MSCIFDAQLDPAKAQTHALVIGVGEYPHLPQGRLFDQNPAVYHFNLGQLTSPVTSASRLADWLLTEHHNPSAELGSVRLLLSPQIYQPGDKATRRLHKPIGTSINVEWSALTPMRTAFSQWCQLLAKNPDNVGVFFFSGHGLEAIDRYLVCADFGSDPNKWHHGLANFTSSYKQMEQCRAGT
jgi:hypothetical protein